MTDSPEMLAAIEFDKLHPPGYGEMSAQEAQSWTELEAAECRCVDNAEGGYDDTKCFWHNDRFHSMEGVEEYYRVLDATHQPTPHPSTSSSERRGEE